MELGDGDWSQAGLLQAQRAWRGHLTLHSLTVQLCSLHSSRYCRELGLVLVLTVAPELQEGRAKLLHVLFQPLQEESTHAAQPAVAITRWHDS